MGYAKKNLRDIDDSAAGHGLSEVQEARFATRDLGAEQTGLNYMIIKPGRREAFAHRHHQAEEIYVVMSGAGQVKLDDEVVNLEALDAVRVSPGITRMFEAGPSGLEVLVFGARHENDAEIVSDFWD